MLVKAASLVTVVNASGEEMDQGSMMRFLSEMVLYPTAFLSDNVSFELVDDMSARVTFADHGRSVTGTLHVDEVGRLTDLTAVQWRTINNGYELTLWSTPVTGYGKFEGLRLPISGKAVWHLPGGDYEYIHAKVTDVRYDSAVEADLTKANDVERETQTPGEALVQITTPSLKAGVPGG